jgi:hypothetical protein
VTRADAEFVRAHTGQAIGGVAPIGHPAPIPTLVDRALARYPVVWAAAGHPKSIFPSTFAGLVALTSGTAVDVSERSGRRVGFPGAERQRSGGEANASGRPRRSGPSSTASLGEDDR